MAASAERTPNPKPDDEQAHAAASCEDVVGFIILGLLINGVVHLVLDVWHITHHHKHGPLEYSVTIDAVTGFDPANDLHAGALLHPAFNLSLVVASPRKAGCVEPGTTVEVSYLRSGVPLATGPVPAICVGGRERREEGSIVAWGDGVRLPDLLLDSLAADMLRGAPEFGVKLIPVLKCDCDEAVCQDTVDVISCWAMVGGGPAPCSVSKERVSFPPLPRRGVARDSVAKLPRPSTP